VSPSRASFRTGVAALVLASSVVLSASSPATPPPSAPVSRTEQLIAKITIDNFGRVNNGYYRGAQPQGHDYADLAALGVKTVIDLTADGDASEAATVKQAGMNFFRIPMTTSDEPRAAAVTQFLGLVNESANQPVYVHCQGGRHRTGVMTAVYRMTQDGWNADQAFSEMQKYKFGPAFLHSTLKDFVYDYYSHHDRTAPAAPQAVVATGVLK
jgi:protein tyrosine/serine phosphatase